MKFVYPEFLWALSLLLVPIIIHLFNFRKYKTIEFSDVRFLKEVKEETRKKSNLKHILILISRLLALTALVLAFAQPFQPDPNQKTANGQKLISIYVDNSFSMDSEGNDGRFLDMAKQIAVELVENFGSSTQFQLLTNKLSGNEQRIINKDQILTEIGDIEITSESRSIPDIYKRQTELFSNTPVPNQIAYHVSDFQSNMMTEQFPNDSLQNLNTIFLQSNNRSNAFIDSVWFETPVRKLNAIEVLKVRISNESDSLMNVKLTKEINGQSNSIRVSVQPHSSQIAEMKYANKVSGPIGAKLYLTLNAQMRFDDTLYFAYSVLDQINILEIGAGNTTVFDNIYGNDELFNFTRSQASQIDVGELSKQNLIIINGLDEITSGLADQLKKYVVNGGNLSVFPSSRIDIDSYARFLTELGVNAYTFMVNTDSSQHKVKSYNKEDIFFQNVFESDDPNMNMPKSRTYYKIFGSYASKEVKLFTYFSGDPFLSKYKVNGGRVYLSSVALSEDQSNFVKHGLFVTSALRMAELSFSNKPLYQTIGSKVHPWISDENFNPELNFTLEKDDIQLVPIADRTKEGIITLVSSYGKENNSMIRSAGVYDLKYDGKVIGKIAFNYERKESILKFAKNNEEVKAYYANFNIQTLSSQNANEINDIVESLVNSGPKKYWKLCLILALGFIAIEILLIKLWKN